MSTQLYDFNIYADGHDYIKGFLGLDWAPSDRAKANKRNYESQVITVLKKLWGKYTSAQVILAINARKPKTVSVVPRAFSVGDGQPMIGTVSKESLVCSAQSIPDDKVQGTLKGSPAPAPGKDMFDDRTVGSGTGSGSRIKYNPWVYNDNGGKDCPGAAGRDSDEILLHEMVHSLSAISGKLAENEAGPRDYTSLEEFTAIVVSNLYASETGRPLRRDHGGFEELVPVLQIDANFYDKYKDYMQAVVRNHGALATALAKAKGIPFNPFQWCQF